MKRLPAVLCGLALLLDLALLLGWATTGGGDWAPLLAAGSGIALTLIMGGTWQAVLWGGVDRLEGLGLYALTILAHMIPIAGVRWPYMVVPVVSLAIAAVGAGVATERAWERTSPQPDGS